MKHFTLLEFTFSKNAQAEHLDNTPTPAHRQNIEELCTMLLDPLREAWAIECAHAQLGTPALRVSSGYRGFRINKAAGGAATSAHCVGYAADLVPLNGKLALFRDFTRGWLKGRAYDQMISENETNGVPVWIHLGYKNQQGKQRRQQLLKRAGSTKYTAV
ncbi:MAG: D-Ala-D-Ala carboxypeptidase family metallohydrolase [Alistipes sp.]